MNVTLNAYFYSMKLWKYSGTFMIATAIIHNLVGFVMGWSVLQDIARDGFVNSVIEQMDRNAIFWFLFSGFIMLLLGIIMHNMIREQQKPVPKYIAYHLLVLSVIGCIMMPASGFWIVLPQCAIIIFSKK